jgi:hypothetical protein
LIVLLLGKLKNETLEKAKRKIKEVGGSAEIVIERNDKKKMKNRSLVYV